jgi:hypothetical protein
MAPTNSTEKFLERKWRKFFRILDMDHKGKLVMEDSVLLGQRFAAASNVPEERKAAVRQHFMSIWEAATKDEKLTEIDAERLVQFYIRISTTGLRKICDAVCPIMFQAIDTNGDGFIRVKEFRDFFNILFKDDTNADKSFETIDLNKDGKLSGEEFAIAFTEFLSGEDQKSPYQFFFGSLDV